MFKIGPIPFDIQESMINKCTWRPSCPIYFDQLSLVQVEHYDFNDQIAQGQLIVASVVAKSVLSIFQELLRLQFPIYSIKLIDNFDSDDERSMTNNNSSCFNYRNIPGTSKLSMHSYGLAIDVNPVQNPMIVNNDTHISVYPAEGIKFLDRKVLRLGMVEPIVQIFKDHDFTIWGGDWADPIDYHHFQTDSKFIDII